MAAQVGQPFVMPSQGPPPYAPMVWLLGGPPIKQVDIPIQTLFMVLFLVGAGFHMKIFRGNKARGCKFLFSLFIFIFCMSRALTSILRIASASNPDNIQLALVAQVFTAAGVVILFIINLVFTTRLVRSVHPSFGWHPAFSILFKIFYALIGFTIISLIATTIDNAYTLDLEKKATDRDFMLYGATLLAIMATLPIVITVISCVVPYSPVDEFGVGRFRTKVVILLISSTLLSLGAWYRCGAAWQTPVPQTQPLPGYLAKGPFYVFNFLVEILVVLMYALFRVDQRWHIPNGAHGPGSYSRAKPLFDVEMQNSRPPSFKSGASSSKFAVSEFEADDAELDEEEDYTIHSPFGSFEKSHGHNNFHTYPIDRKSSHIDIVLCHPSSPRKFSASAPSLQIPDVTLSRTPSLRTSVLSHRLTRVFSRSSSTLVTSEQQAKRNWRASEEARIVRRLGGPWERLTSPTDPDFPVPPRRSRQRVPSSLGHAHAHASPTPPAPPLPPLPPLPSSTKRMTASTSPFPPYHEAGIVTGTAAAGGAAGTARPDSPTNPRSPLSMMFSSARGGDPNASGIPSIPDLVFDSPWTPKLDWEFMSPKRWVSLKKKSVIGYVGGGQQR